MSATEIWEHSKDFFNSVFLTSIVGAFAGAYGAQVISEKIKKRQEILSDVRNTNAAIMMSFSICNTLLSIKNDHVKNLRENYEKQKSQLLLHKKYREEGKIPKEKKFEFTADLETLSLPELPIGILQNTVIEKVSITGRSLLLATTLTQVLHSLGEAFEKRNSLIQDYKLNNFTQSDEFPILYFGLPYGHGSVNLEYSAAIGAIYSLTDDGIFFSQLLCKDLNAHGKELAKVLKNGAPVINNPDFAKGKGGGLMPNEEKYKGWISMFVPIESRPTAFRKTKAWIKGLMCRTREGQGK